MSEDKKRKKIVNVSLYFFETDLEKIIPKKIKNN